MELIPALDLRRGRLVRLTQGEDSRRREYPEAPEAWLEALAEAGFRRVHVVDLDAALGETPQRERIARWPARYPGIRFQLGGGVRSSSEASRALAAGFDRVVVGSWCQRDPSGFRTAAHELPGRFVPALDSRAGRVAIEGWLATGERTPLEAAQLLRDLPCPAVLVTGIERDGTLAGADLELASLVHESSGLPVLVSGGVAGRDELLQARRRHGIAGVVVGRALLEGILPLASTAREFGPRPKPSWGGFKDPHRSGLAVRVIPCLDVAGGRVVKGIRFEGLRDEGDPAELATRYALEGADELAFLDIQAAPEARGPRFEWVERVAERVFLPLAVGGGVRSPEDARGLLAAGADKVVINTQAVEDPRRISQLAERFGRQCVVVAIDARRRGAGRWEVVTHGGRRPTSRDVARWAREAVSAGAGEILLTSIDRDGTQAGYDLELIRSVARGVEVPIVASGGACSIEDFVAALQAGASAVLAASVFHHRKLSIDQVHRELARRGFPVRSSPGSESWASES